jgi:diguanylate cyclase (GGDEF)-like protein
MVFRGSVFPRRFPAVYQKLKFYVFTLLYLVLWTRFFFMLWDPYWSGASLNGGLAVYRDWRSQIDWMYYISGYLMTPVYFIYAFIAPFIPKLSWFPGMYMVNVLDLVQEGAAKSPQAVAALNSPLLKQAMQGYLDWLVPIGVILYRLLNPILDWIADFFKNLVWNVLIEFSFTKRKEGKYQEVLEKRAADLMKLNVEYKNLSKEASMLAVSVVTDELTKVYNKRFFLEKIAFEFKNAKDKQQLLSIAMVDIDHFKKLNDNYGHLLGDKVLQAVAHVAKRSTPNDCFCCRFGGEEFAIIMPGKTREQAIQIIGKIHESLPLLRFEEDPALRTAASFGICVADFRTPAAQAFTAFEDIIKLADDELYRAKLNGRNRIECNVVGQ